MNANVAFPLRVHSVVFGPLDLTLPKLKIQKTEQNTTKTHQTLTDPTCSRKTQMQNLQDPRFSTRLYLFAMTSCAPTRSVHPTDVKPNQAGKNNQTTDQLGTDWTRHQERIISPVSRTNGGVHQTEIGDGGKGGPGGRCATKWHRKKVRGPRPLPVSINGKKISPKTS